MVCLLMEGECQILVF